MKLSYLSWRTYSFAPVVIGCLLVSLCLALTVAQTPASTWDMVFPAGVGNVASVWFADSQIGVVGGSGGHGFFGTGEDVAPIAFTRDGGRTWGNAWLDRPTIKHAGSRQFRLGLALHTYGEGHRGAGVELDVFYQANKYVLKARIPFELLAVEYTPGLTARDDFGVIYSDLEGSRNVYRSYWANTDPIIAIVNDVPSEAVLKPAGWGKLIFE